MHPKISVTIPAYNAAAYLRKAVDSVLAQTEPAVEVIVVDDASKDDTFAVASSYTDPRVRVLQNPTNAGPSLSRNRALDAARGAWVALLDADDWYLPERLERLLAVAERERADLVADDHFRIRDGEARPYTTQFRTSRQILRKPFVMDPVMFVRTTKTGSPSLRLGCSKPLMRKAFLDANGIRYDEKIWFTEDFILYLRCLLAGARFVVVPEPYYFRRMHASSITAGDTIRMLEHEIALLDRVLLDPALEAKPDVAAALRQHQREVQGHLAFRRLTRQARTGSFSGMVQAVRQHSAALPFIGHRLWHRSQMRLRQLWQILSTGRDGFAPPTSA